MESPQWSNGLKVKGSKRAVKGDMKRRRRATGELYDDLTKKGKKPAGTRDEFVANQRNWKLPGVTKSIMKTRTMRNDDDAPDGEGLEVNYRGGDRRHARAVMDTFNDHSVKAGEGYTPRIPFGEFGWREVPYNDTYSTLPETAKGHTSVPSFGSKKGYDNREDKPYQQTRAAKKAKKAAVSKRKATLGKGGRMKTK